MSEKNYAKQEDHAAEDCRINEKEHSHPDMDCGHAVEAGPGVGEQKAVDQRPFCGPDPTAPGSINGDQDPSRGPGVKRE